MTVYENLQEMLKLAEELRDTFAAQGNEYRAALYARKVEEHKAEIARLEHNARNQLKHYR